MKRKTKHPYAIVACLALAILLAGLRLEAAEFDPMIAPTKAEWQHFHKMSHADLTKMWLFQSKRGHGKLSDWSWQWRMGWLQRCDSQSMDQICHTILLEGLRDKAMVIRAEAASRIGRRYAGKASKDIITALQKCYRDPRNSRNGNPLFVYERILEALKNLNDPRATKAAQALANSHIKTKAYWATISKK